MKSPYISRVVIKNFRNFKEADVKLDHKQVIIGENNIGKSNFIRALQLILDPTLNDEDRLLEETDFYDGIDEPMKNEEEIKIEIFLSQYEHVKNILAQLADATVIVGDDKYLKITYKFFPKEMASGEKEYTYIIYKGNKETSLFRYEDRKYLNLKVISAIRDVESEIRNIRRSPINKLIKKKYSIKKERLEQVSQELKEKGTDVLKLDEIVDLQRIINKDLNNILSVNKDDLKISLKTMDIDASRILYSLNLLVNERDINSTSSGVNNILYIALLMLLSQETVIPTFLNKETYIKLKENDTESLLDNCYDKTGEDNYFLKDSLKENITKKLYSYLYETYARDEGITILVVEEPEAHLHPTYQRLLYKHIIASANNSAIITTHSTHISSVAPIQSIVHMVKSEEGTRINSSVGIQLSSKEIKDLQRYIDVKRGEIYLAKALIFVEGIAEEYLIPRFAQLMNIDFDRYGIVVCNVNSTDFYPYKLFADALGIPAIIITDGDFYFLKEKDGKTEKVFHKIATENDEQEISYQGNERCIDLVSRLYDKDSADKLEALEFKKQDITLADKYNIFVGEHTLEVDIFNSTDGDGKIIISNIFNELTAGGTIQKQNFKNNLEQGKYDKCLSQIESSASGIGKGRFALRLAEECNETFIPKYIKNAIEKIVTLIQVGME